MISLRKFMTDVEGTIPGGVLRFLVFVPFGFYEGYAENHWNLIKDHIELRSGTHGAILAAGEKIAAKWGQFGFYWNFAVWVPAILFIPPFNIVFGIIDMVITIYLSIATHYQTSYVPHHINQCHGAHDWLRPPGANESFFETAARFNTTATTSFDMCKSFVKEWQYGIVIASIYATISLMSIITCTYTCIYNYRESKRQRRSFFKDILLAVAALPRAVFFSVAGLVYYAPAILFRCLPLSVKSRTRFIRRYTIKAGLGLEEKGEIQLRALKRRDKGNERYISSQITIGVKTPLTKFLGIYDILILVVRDLHYVDIVNLSLVSKSMREVVLPAHDYEQRLAHFRLYTCHDWGRKQCWVCTNQICKGCRHSRALKQTTLYFHLDNCRPSCTPCYIAHVQKVRTSPRVSQPKCHCAPPTANPNVLQRYMKGSQHYASRQVNLKYVSRSVCKECNWYTDAELLQMREKRTKWELKLASTDGMVNRSDGGKWSETCGREGCERPLGRGPRWWICKLCAKECTSPVHGPWVKKEDKSNHRDGEYAV